MSALGMHALLMAQLSVPVTPYLRTFDSAGPAAGEYQYRYGTPAVSWGKTQSALLLTGTSFTNFTSWDAWGSFSGAYAFEMDVTLVADGPGRKHFGFYLDTGDSGQNGYRIVHLDSQWQAARYIGGTSDRAATIGSGEIVVGTSYTLRLELDGLGTMNLKVDGSLIGTYTDTTFIPLRPGFFTYGLQGGTGNTDISITRIQVFAL